MSFFLKIIFSPSVILFVVLCYLVYYLVYARQLHRWRCSNIPFTRTFFLFGHRHFLKIFSNSVVVPLDDIYRDNPDEDLVAFFIGVSPVILIKEPSLIKKVYSRSFDKMFENGFSPVKNEVEYQSLVPISSDKGLWKIGRNALAPSFHMTRFDDAEFEQFQKQIDRLWDHAARTAQLGQPLNGKKAAFNFVVDSLSLWNFGVDENSWEKKTVIFETIESLFKLTYQRLTSFVILVLFPFLQIFNPLRFVPRELMDAVSGFLTETIEHRDRYQISHGDFIDHLMSLRRQEVAKGMEVETSDPSSNPQGIGVKEMVGHTLTWLLAGADTSSQLSLFATHLLSLHPEYQERIRAEIEDTMRKLNVSELSFQVVRQLQFTEYCLLETSRLYPILPALMRCCSEDFQIPGTDYILRKGDRVWITPYSMHRDPRYFKEPHRFYPERFSPENRDLACLDMYVAFGTGPRKCPGYKVGITMAALFVASLLYKFEVKPRSHLKQMDASDFDPRGFTAHQIGEFLVDIVPRKTNMS